MSALPAVAIRCDTTDCPQVRVRVNITLDQLRAVAAHTGWTHHEPTGHDHCPRHSQDEPPTPRKQPLHEQIRDELARRGRDFLRRARQAAPRPALGYPSSVTGFNNKVRFDGRC